MLSPSPPNRETSVNNLNTDPTPGQGLGSFAKGGGMFLDGPTAFVTLNKTTIAAN
jgi:hypothetical protein